MNGTEYLIVKLMEEAAEVQQRASKLLQFGPAEIQAGHDKSNVERLRYEVNDLLAVITLLEMVKTLPRVSADELRNHIVAKSDKMLQFLAYSKALGCVSDGPTQP